MKRRILFLTAAIAGLVCGWLFRFTGASAGAAASGAVPRRVATLPGPGTNSPLPPRERLAVAEWEARLAVYLNGPVRSVPSASPPTDESEASTSPKALADTVLKLLKEPVSASSMQEAVAFFNANGSARYEEFMTAVFERWVREEPEAALAAAQRLRGPTAKAALVWKIFEFYAGNPDIMAKAMTQPAGLIRSVALAALAESVPPGRESEALQAFIKERRPGNWKVGGSFPHALFEKLHRGDPRHSLPADPGAPLRLALETHDPAWRSFLLQTALTYEPSPSEANIEELARDPRNLDGLLKAPGGKLHEDPVGFKKLLAALPEDKRRDAIVQEVALAASRLQNQIPEEQSKNEGVEHFLQELEQTEGAEGFRVILSESALSRGPQGLHDTARWLTQRRDEAGLEDLTRRSTLAEPFTTARWLSAMPLSAERDRMVAIFAETHASVDPDRARVWAESITDPDKRSHAVAGIDNSLP